MKCDCYQILVGRSAELLEAKVHKAICRGQIPVGGVCIAPPRRVAARPEFMQAVAQPAALLNSSLVKAVEMVVRERPPALGYRRRD